MASAGSAPILSTPAEQILESVPTKTVPVAALSDDELYVQYEIPRTMREIREGRRKRVALQFPDEMLVDAPRVFELLRDGLRRERKPERNLTPTTETAKEDEQNSPTEEREETLCILGDTSYGACCVDEVAAEHVKADVVVHYGRTCLSPTARLPVIYVFTSKSLDLDAAVSAFQELYTDRSEKVCLMADIPYSHHIPELERRLRDNAYGNIYATQIIRDPSSLLPNRTLPNEVQEHSDALKDFSIFHISSPPDSLLLILSSRVKSINILPTDTPSPLALEATTTQQLRRRYALITRLATAPIFGILINTLSVSNYMEALAHCQKLIADAGKKSYVFVVGKVSAAKLANFAEVGGWVVIGCWESSLIESKDFYKPVITPFELEIALKSDAKREWDGTWVADFGAVLKNEKSVEQDSNIGATDNTASENDNDIGTSNDLAWQDQSSDDEPPEFDLRTGQYISRTRPMGRSKPVISSDDTPSTASAKNVAPPSSALVQRAKTDVATVNGAISPAAEFLRAGRTWQGLGSDYEVSYERDEDGHIRGAAMEEGRSGVARGYGIGETDSMRA